jgi:hypothetical protein
VPIHALLGQMEKAKFLLSSLQGTRRMFTIVMPPAVNQFAYRWLRAIEEPIVRTIFLIAIVTLWSSLIFGCATAIPSSQIGVGAEAWYVKVGDLRPTRIYHCTASSGVCQSAELR